jgi:hypothetical protein
VSLVTEEPIEFGGLTYVARRNEGEQRWQVFVGDQLSPVGYIELHHCLMFDEDRLMVFDAANRQIGEPKPGKDDGCVGHYRNALNHIRMRMQGLS